MSAKVTSAEKKVRKLESTMMKNKIKLAKLRAKIPLTPVDSYSFVGRDGKPVALKKLFGRYDQLILIHNMGQMCTYCSLWADGFNGLLGQIARRAAFVVETPDPVATQRKLAKKRGWKFDMVSSQGTSFRKEMGYENNKGYPYPGISTFVKKGEKVYRAGHGSFGRGDNFCVLWDMFDLLPGRVKDFKPVSNRV